MFYTLSILMVFTLPMAVRADFCDFVQINTHEIIDRYGCEFDEKSEGISLSMFCKEASQKDSMIQTICDLGFLRGQQLVVGKDQNISLNTLEAYGLKNDLKNLCQKDVERILKIFFPEEEAQVILEFQNFERIEPYLNRKITQNDTSTVTRTLEKKNHPTQKWIVDLLKNEVDHFWWKGLHYGHYCKNY